LSVAEHLVNICNFDAAACVLRALRRDELRVIDLFGQAQVAETLKRLTERSGEDPKETGAYTKEVRANFESWKATLPNIRAELKEEIDKRPQFVDGLINWEKRWLISQKPAMLYRFQNKPFMFWSIPQIQSVIQMGPTMTENEVFEKLYSK